MKNFFFQFFLLVICLASKAFAEDASNISGTDPYSFAFYLLDEIRIDKVHKTIKDVDVGPLSIENKKYKLKITPNMNNIGVSFTIKF